MANTHKKLAFSVLVYLTCSATLQAAPIVTTCTIFSEDRGSGKYEFWFSNQTSSYLTVPVDTQGKATFYSRWNEGAWQETTLQLERIVSKGVTRCTFNGGIVFEGYSLFQTQDVYFSDIYDYTILNLTPGTIINPVKDHGDQVFGTLKVKVVWNDLSSLSVTGDVVADIVPTNDFDGTLNETEPTVAPDDEAVQAGDKTKTNNIFQLKVQPLEENFKTSVIKPVTAATDWKKTHTFKLDYWNSPEFATQTGSNQMEVAKDMLETFMKGIAGVLAFLMVWGEFKK